MALPAVTATTSALTTPDAFPRSIPPATRLFCAAGPSRFPAARVLTVCRSQGHVPHVSSLNWQSCSHPRAGLISVSAVAESSSDFFVASTVAATPSVDDDISIEAVAEAADVRSGTNGYLIVNFYHLSDIAEPEKMLARHRAALQGLDIRGRIYISKQGINAQLSGLTPQALEYARWVESQPEFQGLRWTKAEVDEHMFPRLKLQHRRSLVSLAGGTDQLPITDPSARATPLAPAEWKEMLRGATRRAAAEASPPSRSHSGESAVEVGSADQLRRSAAEASDTTAVGSSIDGGRRLASGGIIPPDAGRSKKAPPDGRPATMQYGYKSRPGLSPEGAPETSGAAAPAWRSLGRDQTAGAGGGGARSTTGDVVVLDIRNGYEWDAGHFAGSERPSEDAFRETPTDVTGDLIPAALEGRDSDTPIMMYCTGGIRCDIYSAYLRKKGFNKLYTLEGGVHNYLTEEGGELWNGSLFVFDGRLAVAPPGFEVEAGQPLQAAVACQLCGGVGVLPHRNCANLDCNRLFIACSGCAESMRSCCCDECVSAPRLLRPATGNYGALGSFDSDFETQSSITSGRGEGRRVRRRAWQQRLHQKRAAARAERNPLRAAAQAAYEAKLLAADMTNEGENPDNAGRSSRLQELREKLQNNLADQLQF